MQEEKKNFDDPVSRIKALMELFAEASGKNTNKNEQEDLTEEKILDLHKNGYHCSQFYIKHFYQTNKQNDIDHGYSSTFEKAAGSSEFISRKGLKNWFDSPPEGTLRADCRVLVVGLIQEVFNDDVVSARSNSSPKLQEFSRYINAETVILGAGFIEKKKGFQGFYETLENQFSGLKQNNEPSRSETIQEDESTNSLDSWEIVLFEDKLNGLVGVLKKTGVWGLGPEHHAREVLNVIVDQIKRNMVEMLAVLCGCIKTNKVILEQDIFAEFVCWMLKVRSKHEIDVDIEGTSVCVQSLSDLALVHANYTNTKPNFTLHNLALENEIPVNGAFSIAADLAHLNGRKFEDNVNDCFEEIATFINRGLKVNYDFRTDKGRAEGLKDLNEIIEVRSEHYDYDGAVFAYLDIEKTKTDTNIEASRLIAATIDNNIEKLMVWYWTREPEKYVVSRPVFQRLKSLSLILYGRPAISQNATNECGD